MDKKNFIIGILFLFAAFSLFIKQERQLRTNAENMPSAQPSSETVKQEAVLPKQTAKEVFQYHWHASNLITLENSALKVHFSLAGGGIQSVELKHHAKEQGSAIPYTFNERNVLPALSLLWDTHAVEAASFTVTAQTDRFLQLRSVLKDGSIIVRGYRLAENQAENPYLIQTEISVQQQSYTRDHLWLSLGNMPSTPGDTNAEFLNFCVYNGKDTEFKQPRDFEASNGFFGLGKHAAVESIASENPYVWGALKNQFFTSILTPSVPAIGYITAATRQANEIYMQGFLKFALPSQQSCISATYFVGPKDYILLDRMGREQDQLMQFGFFGAVSKILLMAMHAIHRCIPNWGWTIIVLTMIIKLLMWPITQAQLRSSKKMSSIQEPLKKIREKYKGNPQKLQMETMRIFKENRVNPAAGCLPVFIQIPIFIGLYYMLRTSSEIRFQSFLWIKDLSLPDTICTIGSFPVNIMPLLMGVTMFVQMKLTPTPTMDGMQQKMITWMPFIFLFFCYNFPSALVLYWTIQNLFTIIQQGLTRRTLNSEQPITIK